MHDRTSDRSNVPCTQIVTQMRALRALMLPLHSPEGLEASEASAVIGGNGGQRTPVVEVKRFALILLVSKQAQLSTNLQNKRMDASTR